MALVPSKRKSAGSSSASNSIPYNEDSLKFRKGDEKESFKYLSNEKTFIPTVTPHLETLRKLKVEGEVKDLLISSGLAILLKEREVQHYRIPTIEFTATFEAYDDGIERGWSFQLGGTRFKRSHLWLCEVFEFPVGGEHCDYDRSTKDAFWKNISTLDMFCPMMSPKMIQSGAWKIIHRIIAMSINTRKEGGRYVTSNDIDIMIAMSNGDIINWVDILGNMFENFWKPNTKDNNCIGGSLFVAVIARELGFNLSTATPFPTKPLDLSMLVSYQILNPDKKTFHIDMTISHKVQKTLHNRKEKESNAEKRKGKKRANVMRRDYIPDSDEDGPSRYEDMINRLENLETFADEQRAHNKRMDEKFDWMMTTFAGYATHQGFTSFAPPPMSFDASSVPGPSTQTDYTPTFDPEIFPSQDPPAS